MARHARPARPHQRCSITASSRPSAACIQLLIWAQEEDAGRGPDSRLYIVCLDEMNLAQVEHYFSGFLQALERTHGPARDPLLRPRDGRADRPVRPLADAGFPRSLRFVGTVNFDETTRQLSQRVLDRANLIRLHPSRTARRRIAAAASSLARPGDHAPRLQRLGQADSAAAGPPRHGRIARRAERAAGPPGLPAQPAALQRHPPAARQRPAGGVHARSRPSTCRSPSASCRRCATCSAPAPGRPSTRSRSRWNRTRSASPSRCNLWKRSAIAIIRLTCCRRGRANDGAADLQLDLQRRAGRRADARRGRGDGGRAAAGSRVAVV